MERSVHIPIVELVRSFGATSHAEKSKKYFCDEIVVFELVSQNEERFSYYSTLKAFVSAFVFTNLMANYIILKSFRSNPKKLDTLTTEYLVRLLAMAVDVFYFYPSLYPIYNFI